MYKFYGLRLISIFLRTVGWLAAVVGILTIILPYIPESIYLLVKNLDELSLYELAQNNQIKFIYTGLAIFAGGIITAGFGDLFKVFIAIADNTGGKTRYQKIEHNIPEINK